MRAIDTFIQHYWELPIIGAILVLGIVSTFFTIKFIKRRREQNKSTLSGRSLRGLIWLTIVIIVITIYSPSIHHIKLLDNKIFSITILKVFLTLYVVLITIFLTRLINYQVSKYSKIPKRRIKFLAGLAIWLFSIIFIIKILTKNSEKILSFVIFKFSKVKISIYDLISLILIISLTDILIIIIKSFFDKIIEKEKLDEGTGVALFKLTSYLIWTISIVFALESMGFDITLLLAGSAALLVGLGMGIQQLFLDFVSGIILLTERIVNVGDIVDVNGVLGKITDLKFRTTIIKTIDNVSIIIPNSKLVSEKITNLSHQERKTRFKVTIGVAYGSDVELILKILHNIASAHHLISKYPAPYVIFEDFGDSALIFSLCFFTDKIMLVEKIKSDLRFEIDKQFREHNITIPFPQQDVYLHKDTDEES